MEFNGLTKLELKQLLVAVQTEIHTIDMKPIYSFSYYYYNEGVKRDRLATKLKAIELEIIYREDDEKFAKYKPMKDKDPLKKTRIL